MQHHLEYTKHDFEILTLFFTSLPNYIKMTENDLALWPLYQNELELNMEKKPQLVFAFSYYQSDDSDDDVELDHSHYAIESIDLSKYLFGASYIDERVYIHLNGGDLKLILDEFGNTFYLKKRKFENYLLKPLDEINPEVYPRSHYFQEWSLIYFMKDMGITLRDFLELNIFLEHEVIQIIGDKIIQAVTSFHEQKYIHTDIKPDNICIQYNESHPKDSKISLIDCESCQPTDEYMDFYRVPTPGTFTYYAPEIFLQLPSYVHDFETLMVFQKLSFEVINRKLDQQLEKRILKEHDISLDKLTSSDFLHSFTPEEYMNTFMKKYEFGVFNVKTDLFALGCVLKDISDWYTLQDSSSPLIEQMQRLTDAKPGYRKI